MRTLASLAVCALIVVACSAQSPEADRTVDQPVTSSSRGTCTAGQRLTGFCQVGKDSNGAWTETGDCVASCEGQCVWGSSSSGCTSGSPAREPVNFCMSGLYVDGATYGLCHFVVTN